LLHVRRAILTLTASGSRSLPGGPNLLRNGLPGGFDRGKNLPVAAKGCEPDGKEAETFPGGNDDADGLAFNLDGDGPRGRRT
jgi:hypothetical protein